MARTTIAAQALTNPYPTALTAVTFTAADTVNFNQSVFDGASILLARNVHATTPFTVTLTSATDSHGRTKDITAESLAAGAQKAVAILEADGWRQTDGFVYFQGSDVSIQFAVLKVKA